MVRTPFSRMWLNGAIKAVVIVAALYHLSSTYFHFMSGIGHLNVHLFFTLLVTGLVMLRAHRKHWLFWLCFIVASAVGTAYVQLNYQALEMRSGYPTAPDMVIGVILVVVTIIACWSAFGPAIPILVTLFIAYALFGFLIPGYFHTFPPELPRLISHLSIGLQGVYGTLLASSAHYIFLFILLGGILEASAAKDVLVEFGRLIGRGTRGGTAHAAVVSSALIGMITGSSAANVAITGAVTIPTMKAAGYPAENAGAIEAAASQGGQIMPPVMGAAVFVMAELTGISYVDLCLASLIPAVIYFIGVGVSVELHGRRLDLPIEQTLVDRRKLFSALPLFIIPLLVLVVFLALRYPPDYAAFWAIITLLITMHLRPSTRLHMRKLTEGIEKGVVTGAQIAASCAGLGILLSVMTTTGLSVKLPKFVEFGSQGNMWLGMTLTMLISLLLGCGLPTLAAYLIVAIVTAPVLVNMGVPLLAAHMAAFYFAIFAGVTPPFAPTALVASGIARSKFLKTSLEAMKIAFPGLLLPFLWVTNPVLLADFSGALMTVTTLLGVLLFVLSLNVLFAGFYIVRLGWLEKAVTLLIVLGLGLAVIAGNYRLYFACIFLFGGLTLYQMWKKKQKMNGLCSNLNPKER